MSLAKLPYYIAVIFPLITLIIITVKYKKYKSRFTFYFLCFIYATAIIEIIGFIFLEIIEEWSSKIYNIYTFFEFNFITLAYLSLIRDKQTLKLIKYLNILFNVIYFASFLYISIQGYTITIEYLIVSVFFIAYLRELLKSDQIVNYKKHLPFWITTGFLIFYLSSIPFQFIRESLEDRELFFIQMFLIYIMHGCFIYGLLWSKKET